MVRGRLVSFLLVTAASATTTALGTLSAPAEAAFFGTRHAGDGTYYGATNAGHCSLTPRPAQYAGMTGVAVSTGTYARSSLCGACIRLTGSGRGSGANPITGTRMAYVMDECPSCGGRGDVDLAAPGDGRWDVSWTIVPCPTAGRRVAFLLQGSNRYYVKVQVRNTAAPASAVAVNGMPATRVVDNFWVAQAGGGFALPLRVTGTTAAGGRFAGSLPNIVNDQELVGDLLRGGGGGGHGGGGGRASQPPPPPASSLPRRGGGKGRRGGGGGHPGGRCSPLWAHCGGRGWRGARCCRDGAVCRYIGPWHSQCRPAKEGGGDPRHGRRAGRAGGCSPLWAHCGGRGWRGARCCRDGAVCRYIGPWHSQCRPANE
ncbi:hypothetical protein MMPV_000704 [Pyropia vietnamensis]